MKWNIFKRVAELEQLVKDLKDFTDDHSLWIARLGEKVQKLESANQVLVNSNQALIGRHENIGKRLQNLEQQVYIQSRDPQIAALEQQVKDLTDFSLDHSRSIGQFEGKLIKLDNKLFMQAVEHKAFSAEPVHGGEPVFTKGKVDEDLLKKRQYQRAWYAKKRAQLKQEKNVQAAREKKRAYARAYYARTKGAKK